MPDYSAPLQQMRFTIEHLADFKDVAALQSYSTVDADTVEAVLEEELARERRGEALLCERLHLEDARPALGLRVHAVTDAQPVMRLHALFVDLHPSAHTRLCRLSPRLVHPRRAEPAIDPHTLHRRQSKPAA